MLDTVPGAGDTAVNIRNKDPYPHEAYILAGIFGLISILPKQTVNSTRAGKVPICSLLPSQHLSQGLAQEASSGPNS